jgi:hypothetical protein
VVGRSGRSTARGGPRLAIAWLAEAQSVDDLGPVTPLTPAADMDVDTLAVPGWIRQVIVDGGASRYPSRSEAVFSVVVSMIRAGYDDARIAGVLLDARFGIADKPRQQGARWLAHEIARARRKRPVGIL